MERFGNLIGLKPIAIGSNPQISNSKCKALPVLPKPLVPCQENVSFRALHFNVVKRRSASTRASASKSTEQNPSSSKSSSRGMKVMIDLPRSVWRQTLKPLSNFGFGKKNIGEGGVGLFIMSGAVLLAFTILWLKGFQLRSRFKKYKAVIEFSQACGITVGTPVRIRGFTVGTVVGVKPSLEKIDATIQVVDDKIVIPRNSSVEVNQSGLLMETLIDITPCPPIPTPTAGPLDPNCSKEGLIVCDRERLKGEQGVSLDELVGIFTRLGRQMDEISITKTYDLAERVGSVIEEAKPLLVKIEAMVGDIQPLLKEVRDGGLLKEVEHLTKVLADAEN
uniref:TSA: Wollemia nobilis Ref_Wollemi_Transcript_8943_1754 transcribed RNA sequence n=1 Tax=Wollemia nobilis TaxID=56998 RepID=A0A0C9S972_9CONI